MKEGKRAKAVISMLSRTGVGLAAFLCCLKATLNTLANCYTLAVSAVEICGCLQYELNIIPRCLLYE